jgi:hypothetical protein
MKHLKQVIEDGELNDAIKLYLECHETIECIHNNEFVEVPVGDIEDYGVEEVDEIELDEDSEVEFVSVRTHIAQLGLFYFPECEVIACIVDETEFVEELGIGVFDGNIDEDDDDEDFDDDPDGVNAYYAYRFDSGEEVESERFDDCEDAVDWANDFVKGYKSIGKFVDNGDYVWGLQKGERVAVVRDYDGDDLYFTDVCKKAEKKAKKMRA